MKNRTSPKNFISPHSIGNKFRRFFWEWVCLILFRPTPKRLGNRWRCFLLRLFGAELGNCWLHPSIKIWAPWLLKVGDDTYIDQSVWVYNTYGCEIGSRVIISAETILCTVTHDHTTPSYQLRGKRICVKDDCWITMRTFVCPGITINEGAVVGACAVVTKDVEPWTVVAGNPARFIKKREIRLEVRECANA